MVLLLYRESGARVFLNGCRPKKALLSEARRSGARVFLNGCRPKKVKKGVVF